MTTEIVAAEPAQTIATGFEMLPVQQIVMQTSAINELMSKVMQKDVHYGTIPGCGDKPALLQPGAQKIMLLFGLADDYVITQTDLPNGHREYRVTCRLCSKSTGMLMGSGNGICTTMESKYRYRNGGDYEITDQPIPQDARERKQEYRRQGYGMKKVDGAWCWVKFKEGKSENPDIADTYNTVLKMACKRALAAAVLNTTAASDMFTQDVEDQAIEDTNNQAWHQRTQQRQNAPQQATQHRQRNDAPKCDNPFLGPLRDAMKDAREAGFSIKALTAEIEDLMGCEVEEMGQEMVAESVDYIYRKINPTNGQSDVLAVDDIPF